MSMAVLVGCKQLARIQRDEAPGCITEVSLSVPQGDDNVAAEAGHTSDALGPEPVMETRSGGQRMVIASSRLSGSAGMDVIGEVVHDYGWKLLTSGKQSLRVVRWPRLLEHLSGTLDGRPFLDPVSTWDQARRSLLRSATARAQASALLHHQEASVSCGRRCGRSAVKAAVSLRGQCSRYSAAVTGRQRRYGCISVPLSRSVGRAENATVEGGPKPDGRYATPGNYRRLPARRFRAICGASEWMGAVPK